MNQEDPYNNATMLWDLNLCVDYNRWVPLVPFFTLTTPTQVSSPVESSFHRFSDLPPDIHLLIFQQCDSPTLFQLMYTSSYTRHECLKLFWAQIAAMWCRCEWGNIDHFQQGRPGLVRYDRGFCARIAQVELLLGKLELRFGNEVHAKENSTHEERIRRLWETVAELFPAARTVVLSGFVPSGQPPREAGSNEDYDSIARAVEGCPPHLSCFVSFMVRPRLARRQNLWVIDPGLSWRLVDATWRPPRLLIPHSKLPQGLLAMYALMRRKSEFHDFIRQGLDWLRAASFVRYRTGAEIQCPAKDCKSVFVVQSQWEAHVLQYAHWRSPSQRLDKKLPCHADTPDEIKTAMHLREEYLQVLRSTVRLIWIRLADEFDTCDTEKRERFIRGFLDQMKKQKFLAPGETLQQSQYYDEFMAWFEPSHGYYTGNPFPS